MPDGKKLLLFKVGERAITPFRGSLTRSTNAPWKGLRRIKRECSLQADLVLPAGMKIIFIQKTLFDPQMQITEPNLLRVITKPETPVSGNPIGPTMNEEAMQMTIIPAPHDVEGVVEAGQVPVSGHQHAPPDRRADFYEQEVKLIDLSRLF